MQEKITTSIIVPLYNEERRARPFLKILLANAEDNWEVILVNDGSTDGTLEILKNYNFPNKKIISYAKNMGKGYAVRMGVETAKGDYIIFIDGDGSIHPSQINTLLSYLKEYEIVVGNRSSKDSKVNIPLYRFLLGKIFNEYVKLLYNVPIDDNLCGFKGFRKDVGKSLFKDIISTRWVFDVELFYKIKKRGYSLYQLPIKWSHKSYSKISITDIIKIAINLIILRIKLMD